MDSTLSAAGDWALFLEQIETWLESGTLQSRDSEVPFWAWQDELARLRVWAHDMDLYQTRHTPLGERLLEVPLVKRQISRQMSRIRRLVRDIEEELSNAGNSGLTDMDIDGESEDDKEEEPTTTLQDIFIHLKDSIDGLNRMSRIVSQRANTASESMEDPGTVQGDDEVNLQQETTIVAELGDDQLTPGMEPPCPPERERPVRYISFGGDSSSLVMYICCGCGDGPKLFESQLFCIECHHHWCYGCTLVKY
ncbi:hypothetical protein BJX63DRAFT_219 [Aspergillus granulosus]|uniref:Uncharacterized protein n=1 Tax=Aspergillus granulosus TaxID=176169 RepID=A0ABR4I524_9EURO